MSRVVLFCGSLTIGWLVTVMGCGPEPPPRSALTSPFLTPSERAKLPVEERDDPYVQQHTVAPTTDRR